MEIFNEKIVRMIRLYLSGAISEEERQELERWIKESERNLRFFEEMKEEGRFAEEFPEFCRIDMEKGWRRFEQQILPICGGDSRTGSNRTFRLVVESGREKGESCGLRGD